MYPLAMSNAIENVYAWWHNTNFEHLASFDTYARIEQVMYTYTSTYTFIDMYV